MAIVALVIGTGEGCSQQRTDHVETHHFIFGTMWPFPWLNCNKFLVCLNFKHSRNLDFLPMFKLNRGRKSRCSLAWDNYIRTCG